MISENLFSAKSMDYLNRAKDIARQEGDTKVDTDHLLIALLSEESSPLAKLLSKRGIERREFISKVAEHLKNLKEQIEKAVDQEAKHLINLRSQIMQVKSDIGSVQAELQKIQKAKRQIEEEIQEARRYGDFWSIQSLELELRRLESLEQNYRKQLESVEKSLSSVFKQEDVRAFLENKLSIDGLIRKAIEDSSLLKQVKEIGISPDRVIDKISRKVFGKEPSFDYSKYIVGVLEKAQNIAIEDGEAQVQPSHIATALIEAKDTIGGRLINQVIGGEDRMKNVGQELKE